MLRIIRFTYRLVWLICTLAFAAAHFLLVAARTGFKPTARQRCQWMHRNARRVMRVLASQVEHAGPVPAGGLLVSNHLTYVDIILLGSILPAAFVSKSEVRGWPVFGWFTRQAGTIFIRRERKGDVFTIGEQIRDALRAGLTVVLFPEGTSSDGRTVLPFKSSLLEPVCSAQHPVFVSRIRYEISEGSLENDVCYWGDMSFLPHVIGLLSRPRVRAHVQFQAIPDPANDRKALATQLHAEVMRLKETGESAGRR